MGVTVALTRTKKKATGIFLIRWTDVKHIRSKMRREIFDFFFCLSEQKRK